MSYNIKWHEDAVRDLKRIDKTQARRIIDKVGGYLVKDPARLGKPLKGLFKGLYAYRCGDFRVLYALDREQKMILIETVGDRKTVYKD